jgi:hypothetical protein
MDHPSCVKSCRSAGIEDMAIGKDSSRQVFGCNQKSFSALAITSLLEID